MSVVCQLHQSRKRRTILHKAARRAGGRVKYGADADKQYGE